MTNAETISLAAARNELISKCRCMNRPGKFDKPLRTCGVCGGHGWFRTCPACEGCGLVRGVLCDKCHGNGTFAESKPIVKKPSTACVNP